MQVTNRSVLTASVEACRTADGGYNRTPALSVGSTYATFLTALCYEEIGRVPADADRTVAFLRSRLREDGGFAEVGPMKRGGAVIIRPAGANPRKLAAMRLISRRRA